MTSFVLSTAPLFVWWSRIRFSCPLDLVVRSFGLGLIGMFYFVLTLFYFATSGPMGVFLESIFGWFTGLMVSNIMSGVGVGGCSMPCILVLSLDSACVYYFFSVSFVYFLSVSSCIFSVCLSVFVCLYLYTYLFVIGACVRACVCLVSRPLLP